MNVAEIKVYRDKRKGVWYGKYKKDGKWTPKYVPSVIQPKADAKRWFRDWLVQCAATPGTKPAEPSRTIRGLYDWWLFYLAERNASHEVVHDFTSAMTNYVLTHAIADMDVESIEAPQSEDWICWLKAQVSKKTGKPLANLSIRNVVKAARTFFEDAIRRQKIRKDFLNPFRREMIKTVMPKNTRVHGTTNVFLMADAVCKLLSCAQVPYYRRCLYFVAVATGARDNELAGFMWKDLRQESGMSFLRVERQLKEAIGEHAEVYGPPKKDSYRDLPLHPEAAKVLRWWKDVGWSVAVGRRPQDSDPIFPVLSHTRGRRPTDPQRKPGAAGHWRNQAHWFREALKKAGLPEHYDGFIAFDFKSLRRTFVTLLEMAGTTKERRNKLMGHAGESVSDRNYIGRHLADYYAEVCKLPLPSIELVS